MSEPVLPQPEAPATPPPAKRRTWLRVLLAFCVILAVIVGGLAWYASTPEFENLVRRKLISVLEQATGGRVELGAFRWSLRHLAFEADQLTIHGLEAANEVPYAHVDRVYVRVKIISFFQKKKIDVNYIEADHPVLHLIVYPDGTTNQPRPKTQSTGESAKDTIFDLGVDRTEIRDGVALVNQKAIPFNLAANNFGVVVTYSVPRDHYLATVQADDITAQRGKLAPVHSHLDLRADVGRNTLDVSQLQLQTGSSSLQATASLKDFTNPQWKIAARGAVDIRQVMALAPVDGVENGVANLNLNGQGTGMLFTLDGQVSATGAAYHVGTVHVRGVRVDTALHATQDDLTLNNVRVRLPDGGSVDAEIKIAHWLGTAATAAKQTVAAVRQGTIRAKLRGITLRSGMSMVAPREYTELGFNTVVAGDAQVDWTGDADDLAAKANVTFVPASNAPEDEVPLSGSVDATYFQKNGSVQIRHLDAHTPATQVTVAGGLGVYPISRPSTLQVDLTTTNLGEFDRALADLGVAANGKHGVQAIPIRLQGEAEFHGSVSGNFTDPDVKGHVLANNFDVVLPARAAQPSVQPASTTQPVVPASIPAPAVAPASEQMIHWDSLDADAEYSRLLIAVKKATLTRGKTIIHASGQVNAHVLSPRKSVFDERSTIQADVHVQNAPVDDLMAMAGQTIPVTGVLNLDAHTTGALNNLNGGGHLSVKGGEAYGEPYHSLDAELRFAGEEAGISKLSFLQNGGQVTGSGAYNLQSRQFHFTAQGKGFDLAHVEHLKGSKYPVTGLLVFSADGSGTVQSPMVHATAHLSKITVGHEKNGAIDLEAHTSQGNLIFSGDASLHTTQVHAGGQIALSGDYQAQAQIKLTGLDIDPFMDMFQLTSVRGHSSIAGDLKVSGPLHTPRQLQGEAQLSQFAITLEGRPLKSEGPLHMVLQDGILRFDPLHVTGDNTDVHGQGQIGLFRKRRLLNLKAQGGVNLALLHDLDKDVTSSGQVTFDMEGTGTLDHPEMTGQVKFTNVNVSLDTFPNGLSQLNGTLEFDQDRLRVKDMTGTTGGGKVTVAGYVMYQQGIYSDLTITGKDIRIRYPAGISSMIDTKLRLQGTQNDLVLSGNVQLTRFTISPNLDFASFSGPSSSITPPPDPNAFTNHVRLDIHVTSSPELDFQNSYAKLAGDVDLRIRGTVAQPSVLGHISVTEGSATFAGTQYQLQHGDIYFSNPVRIDPVIDLDATAHVEDYDITIGLHGTPSNLSPTFRSEPPLSQQDIFSLLAMGRTQEEQQIYSMQAQQAGVNTAADALLGGALNATVSSRIQKLFGGGSVKIDPSWVGSVGNSTARITVSQQVSKNATLTYATNINSTAQQLIQGEFNLTHDVSVLAVRDESGVFSLMLKVHRRYR